MEITLPNNWNPRNHQLPLWRFLEQGGRRAVAVWNRRAGKDSTAINWTAVASHKRIGTYWHMLPTATQGRLVVWEGKDKEGRRIIDQAFPPEVRKGYKPGGDPNAGTRNDQMRIELKCGSAWQVVGSDNYDRLVGANPVGVVFSEWALTDPRAWDYVRPILAENGGWALFIYTPRGKNHGFDMFDMARHNPEWYCKLLTNDDTKTYSAEQINSERSAGMSEAAIQQEIYCSFEAANEGAYYGRLIEQLEREGRIAKVPYHQELKVDTWWDLGIGDSTVIWFVQRTGLETRVIDYYEASGEGLAHYAKILQDKGYIYGTHWGPHDIEVRELGTGKSRLEVAKGMGLLFRVAPKLSIEDGIEAVRNLLPHCWFDADKCARGLKALKSYHKNWDEKRQSFQSQPDHDWSSHAADGVRTGAVTIKPAVSQIKRQRYVAPRNNGQSWATR